MRCFVCFVCLVAVGTASVAGMWKNELGSQMYLEDPKEKFFDGWYNSSVGHALGTYELAGFIGNTRKTGVCVCWGVVWQNDVLDTNSATTWNGEYDGKLIRATWLLRTSNNAWNSTIFGQDVFRRFALRNEQINS